MFYVNSCKELSNKNKAGANLVCMQLKRQFYTWLIEALAMEAETEPTKKRRASCKAFCPGGFRTGLLPRATGQVSHRNYPRFQGKIRGLYLVICGTFTHTVGAKELEPNIVGDHQLCSTCYVIDTQRASVHSSHFHLNSLT